MFDSEYLGKLHVYTHGKIGHIVMRILHVTSHNIIDMKISRPMYVIIIKQTMETVYQNRL